MKPVRLQLSRAKGYRLQAYSRATNGLAAVNVARPSKWGNRFRVQPAIDTDYVKAPAVTPEIAVRLHREWLERCLVEYPDLMKPTIADLRGKNLACWCAPGAPCHADTLLELANRDPNPA